MQIYSVGGAVRDELLGLPVQDRDYVVVGATVDEMLGKGFRPVGKDFPVFLHPRSHEEYALARTERKTAPGYKGFVIHADVHVTLEEDLLRRDLTINAIAKAEDGTFIDPFDGRGDIGKKIFRHVSGAFSEDPVRILRVARFAARFTTFHVAPETQALMQDMVALGEVDALVAERVWQEVARGLLEAKPSRMFDVLFTCQALEKILPELAHIWSNQASDSVHTMLDAHAYSVTLELRYAVLMAACSVQHADQATRVALVQKASERLKVPKECLDLAVMVTREISAVHHVMAMDAEQVLGLLMRCDGLRKPDRFDALLQVATIVFAHYAIGDNNIDEQCTFLLGALRAVNAVNAGAIAQACQDKRGIADAVNSARVTALTGFLQRSNT